MRGRRADPGAAVGRQPEAQPPSAQIVAVLRVLEQMQKVQNEARSTSVLT